MATELKNVDVFGDADMEETLTNEYEDKGAIFNDIDNGRDELFDREELTESSLVSQESPVPEAFQVVTEDVVPEKAASLAILGVENHYSYLYERDVPQCIYNGKSSSNKYYEAVIYLALGGHKKCDLTTADYARFQLRYENNWDGVDSLYDAWLLLEGRRRAGFDYDGFVEKYPYWEKRRRERYMHLF